MEQQTFEKELLELVTKYSSSLGINVPDFILTNYIIRSIIAFRNSMIDFQRAITINDTKMH